METQIIAIGNQKGGVGKTTISVHLAAYLADQGLRVVLADADPQGSASQWHNAADKGEALPIDILRVVNPDGGGEPIHRQLSPLLGQYDAIILDCPPSLTTESVEGALILANLFLIVVNPSPLDLWSTTGMVALVDRMTKLNPDMITRLVMNNYDARTAVARESKEILPKLGIEPLENYIRHRTAFQQAAAYGTVVSRLGNAARDSTADIEFVAETIVELLKLEGVHHE